VVAGPIAKIGWDRVLGSDWLSAQFTQGAIEVAVAAMIGLAGFSFHWWSKLLSARARAWVGTNSIRWWLPVSVVLFFAYVVGPDIYRRAMVPAPVAPSASEIAAAIAPLIQPKVAQTPSSSAQAPPDIFNLIASLRAQLDAAKRDIAEVQRRLDNANLDLARALKPPITPDATPTWLNLEFDYSGKPSETGSTNVHWAS
jgi:hypothetical protein